MGEQKRINRLRNYYLNLDYTYADTNYKQKQKYSKSFFLTAFSLHICAHLPTPKLLCAIFNRHNLPEYTL